MLYVTALIVAVRLPVLSLLLVLCYLYKTIRILTVISQSVVDIWQLKVLT